MAGNPTLYLLAQDILRRWKIAAAVGLAVSAGALAYVGSVPDEYSAVTVLSFAPRPDSSAGADEMRLILPKFVAYITSAPVVARLAPSIGTSRARLDAALDARIVSDTATLVVEVTLDEPGRAAQAANAAADEIASFAREDRLLEAQVVTRALPDPIPSGPARTLFGAAGVLVGLLAGVTVAALLERAKPRVRTWPEVASVTGHQVVGRIPISRGLRTGSLAALDEPRFGGAIRSIRTNLARHAAQKPVNVLVVTSSLAGEGKTTVALALAIALARLDTSVLLVDGDLAGRGLSRLLGLRPGRGEGQRPGLVSLLRGDAELPECLRAGPASKLSVLPTSSDELGGDLLARRFDAVLDQARARFDMVVVDAPALLEGDDARVLSTQCDAVLLVVAGDTPAYSASEAARVLDALGARVLGAVANRVREPRELGRHPTYVGEPRPSG
ncbi:MAG: AAA family ATPase [Acidimicrobiales bacterium]